MIILKTSGVFACVFAAFVVNAASAADEGLVAHWAFDKGKGEVLHDSSGNANHGTIHGAQWVKSGKGYALRFDGVDDYVDCGVGKSLDLTDALTLEVWAKPTAANSGEPGIVGKFFDSYAITYYGNAFFYVSSGGNKAFGPTRINTWSHFAATFDGKMLRFFINGIETQVTPSKFKTANHGHNFLMGCVFGDPASEDANLRRTSFFPGEIDAVRVYNRAISQREVLEDYNRNAEEKGLAPFDMSRFGHLIIEPFFYPDSDKAVLAVNSRWVRPLPEGAKVVAELASTGSNTVLQSVMLDAAAPRHEDEAEFSLKTLKPGTYELRALVCKPLRVIQAEDPARTSPSVKTYTEGWLAGRMNLFGGWAEYDFQVPAGKYVLSVLAARIADSAGIRCTIDGKGSAGISLNGTNSGGNAAWEKARWESFASYSLSEGRHTLRVEIIPVHVEEENKTHARYVYVDAFSLDLAGSRTRGAQGIERVEFRYPFDPSVPVASPEDTRVPALPPLVKPPKYRVEVKQGGGFTVSVKGRAFSIESDYSFPHGGFNRLAAGPRDRSGEKAWSLNVSKEGNVHQVEAAGKYYAISRRIEPQATRIVIKDKIANKSDGVLGIILSNRVNVKGQEDAEVTRMTNPTIFVARKDCGVGLIALDDLYQLQQHNAFTDGIAEIRDEHFGLDKGASYTIEWAVYPTATADYYDFINQVRRDEGINGRAEGAWVGMRRFRIPSREFIDVRRARYLSAGTPWHPIDDPGPSIEGIEFMDYPRECGRIRDFFDDVKRAHPDVKVMIHVAHGLYCCNNPKERFPDSLAIDASGRQVHYGPNAFSYYGRYWSEEMFDHNWRWWIFYPTIENSFGKAMIKAMEYMMDEMGATAMWADGYLSGYVKGLYSYDRWDGHSVTIDPKTKLVTRKKNLVPYTSGPALKKVIRLIADRGGVLITNGLPGPRSFWKEHYLTSNETGGGDARPIGGLHLGRTVTPLGNPSAIKNERDIYRDILAKLDFGALYWWYGAYSLPSHKTLVEHMYPITFESIHPGTVRGRERIVTKRSGIYGWHGDRGLHIVRLCDARGALTRSRFITTVDDASVRTHIQLQKDQSAVVEKLPITLKAGAPVNLIVQQYDAKGITMLLNGKGKATLQIKSGTFQINPGATYRTKGGAIEKAKAGAKGILAVPLTLDGHVEILIRREK